MDLGPAVLKILGDHEALGERRRAVQVLEDGHLGPSQCRVWLSGDRLGVDGGEVGGLVLQVDRDALVSQAALLETDGRALGVGSRARGPESQGWRRVGTTAHSQDGAAAAAAHSQDGATAAPASQRPRCGCERCEQHADWVAAGVRVDASGSKSGERAFVLATHANNTR